MSRLEAPKRNHAGSSQSSPAISLTITRYLMRVLGGPDAAGRLDADLAAGELAPVAHGLEHDQGDGQRRRGRDLAGGGLDEVAAGQHRQLRGAPDVVVGDELAGLEDDLEVGIGPSARAGLLDRGDLVEDREVVARRGTRRGR